MTTTGFDAVTLGRRLNVSDISDTTIALLDEPASVRVSGGRTCAVKDGLSRLAARLRRVGCLRR